ncbi:uncharacterized protein [Primulina eburnea]|uniref:uncharacterized protein n=1 Tax=Primulina eburnea TaxID=1245227 RepID=UPI003C6C4386
MPESDIYFQPRPKCRFLRKLRSYRGDWKSDFFYAKYCGLGVPVNWSSGLTIIKIKGSFAELQTQCESLGLFNELFDPRCLFAAGTQVDLNRLRSREKTSGRPPPWTGQKIRGNDRDALAHPSLSGSGAPSARSGDFRDSGSRGRQGQNISMLHKGRASGVGLDKKKDLGKKPMEKSKKRNEVSPSDPSKRSREDSSNLGKRSEAHPLLLDGVNRREGAESFWDSSDFGIGLRMGVKMVEDHDLTHLIPHSATVLHQSIALGACQTLSAIQALRAQEDKSRVDEVKLHKDLAKQKEEVSKLEDSASKARDEIYRLEAENASLKVEVGQWPEKLGVKTK